MVIVIVCFFTLCDSHASQAIFDAFRLGGIVRGSYLFIVDEFPKNKII